VDIAAGYELVLLATVLSTCEERVASVREWLLVRLHLSARTRTAATVSTSDDAAHVEALGQHRGVAAARSSDCVSIHAGSHRQSRHVASARRGRECDEEGSASWRRRAQRCAWPHAPHQRFDGGQTLVHTTCQQERYHRCVRLDNEHMHECMSFGGDSLLSDIAVHM
jgi:hypothetical protein